jgi:uncharacterized membrane protein
MDRETQKRKLVTSGILLGIGLGGFFDGIVLHQILQWHHMLSHTSEYPMTTLAGLEANTLADGLFHALTYIFTITGIVMICPVLGQPTRVWSTKGFVGLLVLGWGLFNVVEGLIDHHILRVHNVRDDVTNPQPWNIGFLLISVLMLMVGWWIYRQATWTSPTHALLESAQVSTDIIRQSSEDG